MLIVSFVMLVLYNRARTRQAVRAAGGRIPLSFDYVISAEHTEHFNAHAVEDATTAGGADSVFTSVEKSEA